jgi:hypothetical protein
LPRSPARVAIPSVIANKTAAAIFSLIMTIAIGSLGESENGNRSDSGGLAGRRHNASQPRSSSQYVRSRAFGTDFFNGRLCRSRYLF